MSDDSTINQNDRSDAVPLPPAVTRWGGPSTRDTRAAALAPPFRGGARPTFTPAVVSPPAAQVEETLPVIPIDQDEFEVLSAQAVPDAPVDELTSEVEFLPADEITAEDFRAEDITAVAESAQEEDAAFEVQPFLVAEIVRSEESIGEDGPDRVTELTLSPEFEEAAIFAPAAEKTNSAPDSAAEGVTILELGAMIEPLTVSDLVAATEDGRAGDSLLAEAQQEAEPDAELDLPWQSDLALHADASLTDLPSESESFAFEPMTVAAESAPQPPDREMMPPQSTLLDAARSSGLAQHDLADRLQQLSQRLREEDPETLLPSLARGDRFEVLIAGLLAGYLSAKNA